MAGSIVLDAGCGAGLITIAALAAGAARVVAMDRDPAALESTAANVETALGAEAVTRLELWEADFAGLDGLRLVLAHAAAGQVRTTAAPALNLAAAPSFEGWSAPRRVAAAVLPLHPAWNSRDGQGEVGIWAFRPA